jgi:hypothetical protein
LNEFKKRDEYEMDNFEINSNDLNESKPDMRDLDFDTKNSVNCSWKKVEPGNKLNDHVNQKIEKMEIQKNKNFTFIQSEIDTEIAKNILYSDTGFQGHPGMNGNDDVRQSISSNHISIYFLVWRSN